MSPEEAELAAELALARAELLPRLFRDEQFAGLLMVVVELVAHSHPERLRRTLAGLFDLSAWEHQARLIRSDVGRLWDQAVMLRQELADLRNELNNLRHGPEPAPHATNRRKS